MFLPTTMLTVVSVRPDLARGARASTPLELVATCVVGAFMGLLSRWVDEEITATPAELDAAFRAAVGPGVQAMPAQA